MSDVHCPECDTTTTAASISEAVTIAEEHDDTRHDGNPTARVNGIVPPDFDEDETARIQATVDAIAGGDA